MRNDAFMMDVENTILEAYLNRPVFTFKGEVPKGTARLRDQKWMTHVAACIHDWFGDRNSRHELLAQGADTRTAMRGAEVSVKEYIKWVEDGGGDDWFSQSLVMTKHERTQNERELAELIRGGRLSHDDEMAQNEREVRELVGGA